ncbi:unnamed protein product, partial [Mesorhabditis spiculigera]
MSGDESAEAVQNSAENLNQPDVDQPKSRCRPVPNGFLFFVRECFAEHSRLQPENVMDVGSMAKQLALRWKALQPELKASYASKARVRVVHHKEAEKPVPAETLQPPPKPPGKPIHVTPFQVFVSQIQETVRREMPRWTTAKEFIKECQSRWVALEYRARRGYIEMALEIKRKQEMEREETDECEPASSKAEDKSDSPPITI